MSTTSHTYIHTGQMRKRLLIGAAVLAAPAFIAWNWHNVVAAHAAMEQQRSAEIAAESRAFCEKWSTPAGTERHAQCVANLQTVRDNQTKRFEEDIAP